MTADSPAVINSELPEGLGRKEIRRITERYQQVNAQRLQRIQTALSHEQQRFFNVLPLLLHINHPRLPGYAGEEVPAGLANYLPDRDALLFARGFSSTVKLPKRAQREFPLLGLYLIGSSGTLGQDRHSDFDYWVCHHPDLSPDDLTRLESKLDRLQLFAKGLGLQAHFFLLHAEGFRRHEHTQLSNESSGDTQHHLLLEEFYRSGLLIAGLPPLWWLIPPAHAQNYRAYRDHLIKHRFINTRTWLDFGGLDRIEAQEFFSAAHWQLYKGIDLPYKALLKLMLFETYAAEYPAIHWLSNDIKQLMHSDKSVDADVVDAYQGMLQRIESYLLRSGEHERLALVRRAFYFKVGARLSRSRANDWKHQRLRALVKKWGWGRGELLNLDSSEYWKLARVREERNLLVAELSRSYRLLTEFARHYVGAAQLSNNDLSMLGRKLYASLERRPGKIDHVNPGISLDLSEETVWLDQNAAEYWQLHLAPPSEQGRPAKTTHSLLEMLVWLKFNGILENHSRIDLSAVPHINKNELTRLLKMLDRTLPKADPHEVPLSNFAGNPKGRLSLVRLELVPGGLQNHTGDPLGRISALEHLQGNSWNELQVLRYDGEEAVSELLCAHLNLFQHNLTQARLVIHYPFLGPAVKTHLDNLAKELKRHFDRHKAEGHYLFAIDANFHAIETHQDRFSHRHIGGQRALLDYLGTPRGRYRATRLQDGALPDSPLPAVMRLNRPESIQVCLRRQQDGISLFVLDQFGALHQQWYPEALEKHLLPQLLRFFATLETWHQLLPQADGSAPAIEYLRLSNAGKLWQTEPIELPDSVGNATELILSTGRHGPWKDGFSLLSGAREFNSAELGEDIYEEVVNYVLQLRQSHQKYPLYLTGITIADDPSGSTLSLVELLGFKRMLEKHLAEAMQMHPTRAETPLE